MNRLDAIDRVRKLLALADSTTSDNELAVAYRNARSTMADAGLDWADLAAPRPLGRRRGRPFKRPFSKTRRRRP